MWRVVAGSFAASMLCSTLASAQPCTTDANRVVAEVYRHMLERGPDRGAQTWARRVATGQLNVRELVRQVATSQEYMQRFGQTEPGEAQPYERAVAALYRHVLGRQPDNGGLRNWARVAQQRGLEAVVDGLIDSREYDSSFGDFGIPGSGGLRFCGDDSAPQSSSFGRRIRGGVDNGQDVRTDEGRAQVGTSGRPRIFGRDRGRSIAVGADRQWVDTGINIQAGDVVSITASGQIRVARDGGMVTAGGVASGRTDGATMPTANVGGLVARFGNSAPLFIGERRTFRAGVGGRLYLGVNDSFFDDNTGEFNVSVEVD